MQMINPALAADVFELAKNPICVENEWQTIKQLLEMVKTRLDTFSAEEIHRCTAIVGVADKSSLDYAIARSVLLEIKIFQATAFHLVMLWNQLLQSPVDYKLNVCIG